VGQLPNEAVVLQVIMIVSLLLPGLFLFPQVYLLLRLSIKMFLNATRQKREACVIALSEKCCTTSAERNDSDHDY
jgi:hypothetical protein